MTGRPVYPKPLARGVAARVGVISDDAVLNRGTGPGFSRSTLRRSPAR